MAMPFLTPSRCVLLIGDDALYIYNVTFRAVRLIDAIPWQTDDFGDVVATIIRKECGRKPVMILNDMTDQHFKGGQRLPKVGPMDRANVLARRLQVSFPNYPIRGALQIKQKRASDAKKEGGLYLFAAVPMSEPVAKTMEAVRKSLLSISGFFLLPVEAADMVNTLALKLAGKSRPPSRWVIFIGQHHNGALRQVITRDGQLAMTRMTPVTNTDSDHEAWAYEVSQEFKATISYLSRFGFSPEDGTDVVVVCNPKAGQVLEQLLDLSCYYRSCSATEAAKMVGTVIGVQQDARYADPLHVAWTGRKTKFSLPMKAAELEAVDRPRKIASLAVLLLILGAGYLSWMFSGKMAKIMEVKSDLAAEQSNMAQAESSYDAELQKLKDLGFDVKVVQGAINTFDDLERRRLKTLPFIMKIDQALGNELRLDSLDINLSKPKESIVPGYGDTSAESGQLKVKASLKLSFPPTIEPAFGVREVNSLKIRLEQSLPGYTVNVVKNVAGREFSETVSGQAGGAQQAGAAQEYLAELVVQGEIK